MKQLIPLSLLLLACTAKATPDDQYYSADIFTAIEEARQRTHHYDYSSALRYNRSTSQSIQIPRLLNKEMAQTAVKTPDTALDTSPRDDNGESAQNLGADTTLTLGPNTTPRDLQLGDGTPSPASVTVTVR
ncbi:hypothetical protein ACQUQU_12905 [Thalassolituus sp. LLYu03]|uniref:hypothetical protein n=1 Tax=Thalassolituus sp. LLYu03 TaxID=3421656 RepID=UPI003D2BD6AA